MRSLLALVLGLAVSGGLSASAAADEAAVHTVVYVEVGPASQAEAESLLQRYRDAGRHVDGSRRIEVLRRIDRPNQFVILAEWRDPQAVEARAAVAAARELRDRLARILASPNDERSHAAFAVGPAGAASADDLYVVTHVDVIPPKKDDGAAALARLAQESRGEADNRRFDVLQQSSRPNHFTVVEVWRDRAAFDAHAMAPHTRRFREALGPMSGALYDERLYTRLP